MFSNLTNQFDSTPTLHKKMRKLSLLFEMINKRHDLVLCSGTHQMCNPGRNDNFLIFSPCRESRRKPDPALPRDRSKALRLHPWRLGSDSLRLLQRLGKQVVDQSDERSKNMKTWPTNFCWNESKASDLYDCLATATIHFLAQASIRMEASGRQLPTYHCSSSTPLRVGHA